MTSPDGLEEFIDALPKVELHVHLVGSASVPTVLELAARHPGSPVPRTEEGLRAFYEFRDFPHFAEVYQQVSELVTGPEDIAALVLGAARDLAAQNARHVELTVTPYTFIRGGIPAAAITEALDLAARQSEERHGVRVAYIFDIAAELGEPAAHATLAHALDQPPERLVALGLAGIEDVRPTYRDLFRETFATAIGTGLHSVPHAGETTGPATIWEALHGLHAERIGHGIRCLDDPDLVAHLRDRAVPLEVCPTSNVRTRQVPDLAAHPLPTMLEAGLHVTINSDDPPMFGTTLTNEYRAAARTLGLTRDDLATLATNAVTASYLDSPTKQALRAEIEALTKQTTRVEGTEFRPHGS